MKSKLFRLFRAGWQLLRLIFSSEARAKAMEYVERMRRDGVDVMDGSKRREWIRGHRSEVSQALPGVYSGRVHSHNEPCPCGSKKINKRCCGGK